MIMRSSMSLTHQLPYVEVVPGVCVCVRFEFADLHG